jgi:hypothetical protein
MMQPMKTIVVYESLWGNTAAIALAIAEGIGPEARAPSTAEATAAKPRRFLIAGGSGPLRDGEPETAKAWGAGLAAE